MYDVVRLVIFDWFTLIFRRISFEFSFQIIYYIQMITFVKQFIFQDCPIWWYSWKKDHSVAKIMNRKLSPTPPTDKNKFFVKIEFLYFYVSHVMKTGISRPQIAPSTSVWSRNSFDDSSCTRCESEVVFEMSKNASNCHKMENNKKHSRRKLPADVVFWSDCTLLLFRVISLNKDAHIRILNKMLQQYRKFHFMLMTRCFIYNFIYFCSSFLIFAFFSRVTFILKRGRYWRRSRKFSKKETHSSSTYVLCGEHFRGIKFVCAAAWYDKTKKEKKSFSAFCLVRGKNFVGFYFLSRLYFFCVGSTQQFT